jgi:hypothetical protein
VLPLPTYDPKLEYPTTGAKQYNKYVPPLAFNSAEALLIVKTVDVGDVLFQNAELVIVAFVKLSPRAPVFPMDE